MLLSSIQIQGFKSFADKTVLKFGKGITAVVGPNGSGKSNISDAVRWVLGEQSTKSLRGQSMEDVIFGGTEIRRPHGYCEVTLNIDNSDRTLDFDNDNVAITRRYYRSHESEYAINGVSVRLKDIHELFMDTGLGRDGYSMIGQGKIDNIISSKSGERRDIFEEAAGISKYRYRKLEAERKLSAAEDNLLRLHDINDELAARVGPLAEQSRKAEKFLELAESKKELEIGLWIYTLDNSKEALRSQESKIAVAELAYKEIEEALTDFDKQTEENTAYFAKLTSDIEGERLNVANFNEEIVKTESQITLLNNDIDHNNESISRLKTEIEQLSLTDNEAKTEIELRNTQVAEKQGKLTILEEQNANLENELSGLLTDSESISVKIEGKVRRLNTLTAESADKRVEMVTADSTAEEILSRLGTASEQIEKLNAESETLNKDLEETNKLLLGIEDNITSMQNSLKGYELRLSSREEAVNKLKNELEGVQLDVEAKRRRIQILKELENNMEGFGHSVKSVVNDSKKGILRGICGTVSSVISVESKYSVAIETALAAAVQNLITETEADAKRAINHLKSTKGGRATFLPINSIKSREFKEKGFEDCQGFIGIASDLVSTDKKYLEIVKYLLGGTLIAEDIDSAAAIAKKFGYRIKVVSLDGQVINTSGSLTGGSLIKNAGLLGRAADIEKYQNQVDELAKKVDKLQNELTAAQNAAEVVRADIVSVKSEITTANEDKIRALAELKRIEDLKQSITDNIAQLTDEQTGGKEKLEKLKEVSTAAAKVIADIDAEKTAIQSEIDDMTDGRQDINTRRETLAAEITTLKLNIIELKKDIEATVTAAENIESLMTSRAERQKSAELEIAQLEVKNQELNLKIVEVESSIADLKAKIVRSEENITDLLDKRNQTEKAGVELRYSEREQTLKREQIGGELARLNERKDVMLKEYDDVIRQLYDEYQLTRTEAEKIGIQIEKPAEAKKQLAEIKSKIRGLGNVNVSAIEEYKEVSERHNFLNEQINDAENTRTQLHKLINQLTGQMQEIFVEGFEKINQNFMKTFTELFGGGSASLSLSQPENILESGIDINVKLPGKNVPSLEGLSGGERALIALSIYFAIMRVNTPPFCFLDEVDTALDDINVERFADYMKKTDFATQFICVTHRRGTMEAADMLYGVTMQEKGVTKLLELNVSELEKTLLNSNS